MTDEVELYECDHCGEMKPSIGGETSTTPSAIVDGRVAAVEHNWICEDCVNEAHLREETHAEYLLEMRDLDDSDYYDMK